MFIKAKYTKNFMEENKELIAFQGKNIKKTWYDN